MPSGFASDTSLDSAEAQYGLRQRIGLGAGPVLFVAILLAPTPEGLSPEAWRTAAVGLLMATWWITEAIPIAATALLPLGLFPLLGVGTVDAAAEPYANPLIFLFLGGFLIALGMQRWGLHRRVALRVIRAIGARPGRVVLGFMVTSAFLSMWISNTATAMMMLPIGLSVVRLAMPDEGEEGEADPDGTPDERRTFAVVLMLGIAYACSIGGAGTLIGTPPNALLAGFLDETYGVDVSFARWMVVGLPVVVLGLPLAYLTLTRVAYRLTLSRIAGGRAMIEREVERLGPTTRPERIVAVVFGVVAALWMTRGWLSAWVPGLSDAGIAMAGALVLFVVPADWKEGVFVLDWSVADEVPWGVLLLFGGGLSLASAVERTGLATWIGEALGGLEGLPVVGVIFGVAAVVVLLTELTSNTATTAAFLPILGSVAVGIGQNPFLLVVPAALAASCAFMLPVATPPNAIVYGSGALTIPDMARAGVVLNVAFTVLITALTYGLVTLAFGVELGVVPPWAD
jgi:sodium-dependent dicarboxylate transporter 2/3/5